MCWPCCGTCFPTRAPPLRRHRHEPLALSFSMCRPVEFECDPVCLFRGPGSIARPGADPLGVRGQAGRLGRPGAGLEVSDFDAGVPAELRGTDLAPALAVAPELRSQSVSADV